MNGKSRAVALVVVFFAWSAVLRADLFVSNFGDGQVRRFDAKTGAAIGGPILQGGGGGEGVACLTVGGRAVFYIANNGPTIRIYDQASGTNLGILANVGGSIAAVSLSPDGSLLYVADAAGSGRIAALDTTTGAIIYSTPQPPSPVTPFHDVLVGPDGFVYATNYNSNMGVRRYSPDLSSFTQFIAHDPTGLDKAGGMVFDAAGNFYVSRFQPFNPTAVSFVNRYSVSSGTATLIKRIDMPAGTGPLGLARGPDGNIYSANFNNETVGQILIATNAYSEFIKKPTAGPNPKYVFFTEDCKVAPDAFLEICKFSSITNPVTGNFTFTATNGSFSTAPISLPAGVCSGPIRVTSGTVTVTEGNVQGSGVGSISAYGFNSATFAVENRLVSSNLANRTAAVTVPAGGIAGQTIVEFTNFKTPTGVLEICKEAAPGTTISGNFSFTVAGAVNNPYSIPAGACSGPILVQAGAVTITEAPRSGFVLTGASTVPGDRLVSINIPAGSAVVNVPAGDVSSQTVARFVNGPSGPATGQLKICKVAGPGVLLGQNFTISAGGVNYTVPAGPPAQGGYCVLDGAFPIGAPVIVQETPPAPYRVLNMAVNPPSRINGAPVLSNGNGQVTVMIGSGFTEVTVTNIGTAPTGQLKICTIGGPGVAIGTNFSFSAANTSSGGTQMYTVPAGPPALGGYCISDATFATGTHLNVSELPQQGFALSGITVNGTPLPAGTPSASVTIGSGVSEVAFTNRTTDAVAPVPLLSIVHYELVTGHTGTLTYRAELLNSGTAVDSVIATLSSDDPHVRVISGEDALRFQPVPANSQVASRNTFSIVTDGAAPVDFSRLKWTLQTTQSPPRRRAMR